MSNAAECKPGCPKTLRLLVHRYCSGAVWDGARSDLRRRDNKPALLRVHLLLPYENDPKNAAVTPNVSMNP
jgi:hypothetical protein